MRAGFKSAGAVLLPTLIGGSLCHYAAASVPVDVQVVSSRPKAVSGGDALVRVTPPQGSAWRAKLNGHEVTKEFHPGTSTSAGLLALLTGLKGGENTLEVAVNGQIQARVVIVNHPLAGPVFSGPHQAPFICQTEANGLGPATDADCSAKTVIQYYYKPRQLAVAGDTWITALQVFDGAIPVPLPSGYKPYDRNQPPADVAETVTSEGRKVPYIVRRELGTINRAVYDIRFLHQPNQPLPTPWNDLTPGWNGRLVFDFGGGCAAGYRQGTLWSPASNEALLAQGYAVATSTLNIFANNCNDVISAETASMVKEHFIKIFGKPAHTIGWGGSGGAMQLYLIAQNYPGLLDGIIPYVSFPDVVTYLPSTSDCSLLLSAFDKAAQRWTDEQKTAVTGFATWRVCSIFGAFGISARRCSGVIPQEDIYDAARNPKGARCDIYDNEVNVFGKDAKTGFARRPLDNVGVEYGLLALQAGKISVEQFVELNENAGGYDADGTAVARRTEADGEALRRAYRQGLVMWGGGGLPETAVIDWRWYSDDLADNHDSFRSFVTRARLSAANGTAANQVILIDARASTSIMTLNQLGDPNSETSAFARRERDLVEWMNRWLDTIAADHEPGSVAQKVARDKPADLTDSCWTTAGTRISGAVYGSDGRCSEIYPTHGDPRTAAGAPLTDDVLKCELKPLRLSDFSQPLSSDQFERLKAVFPTGVCDYSRHGIGQERPQATWQEYP